MKKSILYTLIALTYAFSGSTAHCMELPGNDDINNNSIERISVKENDNKEYKLAVIWYPTTLTNVVPTGHTAFVFKNRYHNIRNKEEKDFTAMKQHSTNGTGRPFVLFSFKLTKEQSEKLEADLKNLSSKGITCSGDVSYVLEKYANYSISGLVEESPTLSASYLGAAKLLGSTKINTIEYVGKKNVRTLVTLCPGIVTEIGTFIFLIVATFYIFN